MFTFDPGTSRVFEATVDVSPDIPVPDLGSIQVDAPPSDVSDADVDEQIDRLRDRFAELETVAREVVGAITSDRPEGISECRAGRGGERSGFLYEVGSRGGRQADEELEGNRPGAILKFTDSMVSTPDEAPEDISFTVLLKEVKARSCHGDDDELAKTVGEFETLDELKEDLACGSVR